MPIESGFSATFDLSSLDGSNGFVINGIDGQDNSGVSVSSVGNVNGDRTSLRKCDRSFQLLTQQL